MATSGKERMQATRYRRKRALHLAKVEINDEEIAYLARLGYGARADDPLSLGSAITSFIADAVQNATG